MPYYNRIVYSIASMILQQLGMPLTLLKLMFSTIQDMDYFIWTAFEDLLSKLSSSQEIIPNQDILQGNRVGPTAQIATSIPISQVIKTLRYEIQLIIAIQQEKVRTMGFIFIDNTDLAAGKLYYSMHDIVDIFKDIQRAINTWEVYLVATGGAICTSNSI